VLTDIPDCDATANIINNSNINSAHQQVHLNQSSKIVPSELLENNDTGFNEEYDSHIMLVDQCNGNSYGCSVPMPIIQPQAQPAPPQQLHMPHHQFHPPQYAQYHQPMLQSSFTEQRAMPIGIKNLQLPSGAVPYYPPAHRITNPYQVEYFE